MSIQLKKVAAVLITMVELEERNGEGFVMPCSNLYLFLDMDIHAFEEYAAFFRRIELAEVTTETLKLTPKGREVGKRMNADVKAEEDEAAKEVGNHGK